MRNIAIVLLLTVIAPASGENLKVGLVTDVSGINDKSFNQAAWSGTQKAAFEFHLDVRFLESKHQTDYEKNIRQFARENYDVILSIGFLMGDATVIIARQYPRIKFGILDFPYFPTKGDKNCDETKKDCYADGGLTNVTSLMFQDDQAGFLAGVVAGGMTRTGIVCTVAGVEIPPVLRLVVGYQNGARFSNRNLKPPLQVYIPDFNAPAKGKEAAQSMIAQGCDVVFGVGGNTGNSGLLAAKEKGMMAIGMDVDQYFTYPEVKDVLLTSAMKHVDIAVYEFLKSIVNNAVKAGITTANIQNGGVGIAPYHDWDSKIPQAVKDKVKEATEKLKSGELQTGYKP